MDEAVEDAIRAGAVRALRRRADRQRAIAKGWTVYGERGAIIMTGEAAIAERIAGALEAAADDFDEAAR